MCGGSAAHLRHGHHRLLLGVTLTLLTAATCAGTCGSRRGQQPPSFDTCRRPDDALSARRVFEALVLTANSSHHRLLHFSGAERRSMRTAVRRMFYHGFDNYMRHAFPHDELDPLACRGRGSDRHNPANLNINDVLGDYSLTLVDSLDTLAVLGDVRRFGHAVRHVMQHVHFAVNSTVQVFEANIRVLGALLSAHLLIVDERRPLQHLASLAEPAEERSSDDGGREHPSDDPLTDYDGELLEMAHDLGTRLLTAFDGGGGADSSTSSPSTDLPLPRVNLLEARAPRLLTSDTCTAGAGSLVLEFGLLSRLTGDPVFEARARAAVDALWRRRAPRTGLLGSTIDARSGRWTGTAAGIGAGVDSFYEYLIKAYVMFGEWRDYERFSELYANVKTFMRRGRSRCHSGSGAHPFFVNVDMNSGDTVNTWLDSLQAAFPAVQLLAGDVDEAICLHAVFYAIWKCYGALPERYDWRRHTPSVSFYPLRPELAESTYFLYQATKNPFYLHVGREMIASLEQYARSVCGYATLHNVLDKGQREDRMESFFLSETCKYLYLLFDEHNYINQYPMQYVFSTEGHLFPVHVARSSRCWDQPMSSGHPSPATMPFFSKSAVDNINGSKAQCDSIPLSRRWSLPLPHHYWHQLLSEFHVPS